jgi:hypothetical protein
LYLEGDSTGNTNPIGYNAADCDILVQRCADAGLYLIITIGCNGENGTMDLAWSQDFWNFYGPRYANETHVIYEAHNEPVPHMINSWTTADWDDQIALYHTIRATAPDTFILLGSFMGFVGDFRSAADYLVANGVSWSNAGFAHHGYESKSGIEDAITTLQTSTQYPALLCTEFYPGDTEGQGYNSMYESHFNGWMQFQWLAGDDDELPGFAYKIDTAGTVWTPDSPTCTWPAKGTLDIPADGSLVGIYHRGDSGFVSANGDLEADLATYTGSQNDAFTIEHTGPRLVSLKAANGLYVSTTGEDDTLTAEASSVGATEQFEFIRKSNGDITLRAYGGGGHLPAPAARGRNSGKFLPNADDQLNDASSFALVDGTAPADPPPPPEDPNEPPPPGPYYGTPQAIPGIIVGGDFDFGGEGVAYHDSDAGNNGGAYRPAEDVDIEIGSEGINVAWIAAGEWLNYAVDVASAGTYTITARVSTGPGTFHMEFDGVDKTGPMDVAYTGGYQEWVDVSAVVTLAAGEQVMTFYSDTGGINMRQFTITGDGPPPPNQAPAFSSDPIVEANATEGSAYSASIADDASDPENDPMVFSKVSGPSWLSVASDGSLSGTPGTSDVGLNSFTVQVDATGGSDSATLEITVDGAQANQAPTWNDDPVIEVDATEAAAYSATLADDASDADSDPLTFSKTFGPSWLNVAFDGTLSGTPAANDVGVNSFDVTVSDGINSAVAAVLQITVLSSGGGTATDCYVSDIAMSGLDLGRGSKAAEAAVTILDNLGNPVSGATVDVTWSGKISGTDSGTTDSSGVVVFQSASAKGGGTFTITVDSVTAGGLTYNSGLNVETSDTISL